MKKVSLEVPSYETCFQMKEMPKNDDEDQGSHPLPIVQFFFNIVKTAFDPPHPRFEHVCCNFLTEF